MKKYFILIIFVVFAFAKNDNQDFRFVIVGDRTGNCISGIFGEINDGISLLEPFNEKKWGFNFRRLQTRIHNAEACWSLPFGHYPDNFGIIKFE